VAQQRDPYQVLGVQRTATADEIKKAHRKLVRQYHPDRNPGDAKAEERFKEVQQAYDLLSDSEKRKSYDDHGFGRGGGGAQGGGFGGFDTSAFGDIFNDLFNRGGGGSGTAGGGGRGRGQRGPRPERGRDLEVETQISFAQSIEGAQVPIVVPTTERCGTCSGTGAKPGTSPTVCPRCQGRGVESQGQGLFSISQPCQRCGGSGTIIEDPCPTCRGEGRLRTTRRYRANIPAGVKEGSKVRLAGKGEPGLAGGAPGDLFVVVHVEGSPIFARKGDNLEVEVPLTVPEALQGAEIEVPTLNGRKTLRVAGGTKHGTVQRLRGEGPPKLGSKDRGANHYRFVFDVPASLSAEQREAVDELSKVMNGDPRSGLFAKAKGGA
jgi:molecular chaperone DnaJ